MIKPENTHPRDQNDIAYATDSLETATSAAAPLPLDSPSSQADAGVLDPSSEFNADLDADDIQDGSLPEITMTDLMANMEYADHTELNVPEMDDLNTPGHIDIEALDEDALSDTDIPRDALLDPLEP